MALGVATTYRYNHADRMYAVERGGLRLGEYYYNVAGQLVLRIVTNTMPSGWTMYFYDQAGQLIAEYDGVSGDLLREYVWLEDTPVAVIEAGVTPTIHYIHTDHIGRPIALTDASGSFVNETTWVVFGNAWSVTGTVGVDLRFPGQMYQFESGLHYNWNRQYDPSIARYTQPDPLGLIDGPSRYAYVRNDPMQKVDPTGEFWWGVAFAAVDLGIQLYENGGRFQCVNWLQVGLSSIGGGALNGLTKGAFFVKNWGSHSWGAMRNFMRTRGINPKLPSEDWHHWLLTQAGPAPKWLKNQPWNISPLNRSYHQWLHRRGLPAFLGAPSWAAEMFGGTILSGGAIATGGTGASCGC